MQLTAFSMGPVHRRRPSTTSLGTTPPRAAGEVPPLSLSLSLERTNLINFYDMVLIEAGILI
jgi:hypothetical protein